jgi:chromosome segregation ATPase
MVLELLQQRPEMHEQLRSSRTLLTTLNRYSRSLKASHQAWKERLKRAKPNSDPSQIASEALEIALKELEERLPPALPTAEDGPLFLEEAMAFLRSHMPPE